MPKTSISERNRRYRIKHRDHLYEKFNCECGGKYSRESKSHHFKTILHQTYLKTLEKKEEETKPIEEETKPIKEEIKEFNKDSECCICYDEFINIVKYENMKCENCNHTICCYCVNEMVYADIQQMKMEFNHTSNITKCPICRHDSTKLLDVSLANHCEQIHLGEICLRNKDTDCCNCFNEFINIDKYKNMKCDNCDHTVCCYCVNEIVDTNIKNMEMNDNHYVNNKCPNCHVETFKIDETYLFNKMTQIQSSDTPFFILI